MPYRSPIEWAIRVIYISVMAIIASSPIPIRRPVIGTRAMPHICIPAIVDIDIDIIIAAMDVVVIAAAAVDIVLTGIAAMNIVFTGIAAMDIVFTGIAAMNIVFTGVAVMDIVLTGIAGPAGATMPWSSLP